MHGVGAEPHLVAGRKDAERRELGDRHVDGDGPRVVLASQFATASEFTVKVIRFFAWYETNGCRNIWLTSARSVLPANDHTWFHSVPNVHGATQVHDLSPRRDKTMVRVNCGAIPSALIESELFGREKGAYTGALARQAGRFEVAHRSTLFLDEIGDLPLDTQIKLLRVLQDRQFERLGSATPIKVDVRIIAATNRDLEQAIANGTFREDLYYRINVFPIRIPPLRERPEDIPLLVWNFVDEFSRTFGKQVESVPKSNMLACSATRGRATSGSCAT